MMMTNIVQTFGTTLLCVGIRFMRRHPDVAA